MDTIPQGEGLSFSFGEEVLSILFVFNSVNIIPRHIEYTVVYDYNST
jgi:hypothetical protein